MGGLAVATMRRLESVQQIGKLAVRIDEPTRWQCQLKRVCGV